MPRGGLEELANGVLQQTLKADPNLTQAEQTAIGEWAAALVGAAVGGTEGAAASLDNFNYNYLDHDDAKRKAAAQRELEACEKSANTCSDQKVEDLTNTIAALNAQDARTNAAAVAACASGTSFECIRYLNTLEAVRIGFSQNSLSVSDPDYAAVSSQFYADGRLVAALHSIVNYQDSAELAEMMAPIDLGATLGAGSVVVVYAALAGSSAANSLIATCGQVAACYSVHLTFALQEIQATSPEFGGSGVGGGNLTWPGSLAEAETAVSDYKSALNAGTLSGLPSKIPPLSDAATIRGIQIENESAVILAESGLNVVQNPVVAGPKKPDYLIDGEIFHAYSPTTNSVRNLASNIETKIIDGQTSNVVVNLRSTSVTSVDLQKQLGNYPISGLNKIIIIDQSGNISLLKLG